MFRSHPTPPPTSAWRAKEPPPLPVRPTPAPPSDQIGAAVGCSVAKDGVARDSAAPPGGPPREEIECERELADLSDEELDRLVVEGSRILRSVESARGSKQIRRWASTFVVRSAPSSQFAGAVALFSSGRITLADQRDVIVDARSMGEEESLAVGDAVCFPYYRAVLGAELGNESPASSQVLSRSGEGVPETKREPTAEGTWPNTAKMTSSQFPQPKSFRACTISMPESSTQVERRSAIENNECIRIVSDRSRDRATWVPRSIPSVLAGESKISSASSLFLQRIRRESFGITDARGAGSSSATMGEASPSKATTATAPPVNGKVSVTAVDAGAINSAHSLDSKRDPGPKPVHNPTKSYWTSGGLEWDGKPKTIAEWAEMTDIKGAWVWVRKGSPISASSLGFLASRDEICRFGGRARRITRSEERKIDGRTFAQVVAEMFRQDHGGRFPPKRAGDHHGGGEPRDPREERFDHRDKRRHEDRFGQEQRGQRFDYEYRGREGPPPPRSGPNRGGGVPEEGAARRERELREKALRSVERSGANKNNNSRGSNTPVRADAGPRKELYCHKCTKTGHVQRDCTAPPTCYTCKKPGHVAAECTEGKVRPAIKICGSGPEMFYSLRLKIPEHLCVPSTVTGILRMLEGEGDEEAVLMELVELFERNWNWRLKCIGQKEFLIEFPDAASRREVTKFVNGFRFVSNESIFARVTESIREFEAFGLLDEVWARLYDLPNWARFEDAVWELAYMVGEPREIDVPSLAGSDPVRVRIACKDRTKVDGNYNVYINGRGFRLEWEVEKNSDSTSEPPKDSDDGGKDGEDDEKQEDNNRERRSKKREDKKKEEGNEGGDKTEPTDSSASYNPKRDSQGGKRTRGVLAEGENGETQISADDSSNSEGGSEEEESVGLKENPQLDSSQDDDERQEMTLEDKEKEVENLKLLTNQVLLTYPKTDLKVGEGVSAASQKGERQDTEHNLGSEQGWTLVAHSNKKKAVEEDKAKEPVIGERHSDRLLSKDKGLSIVEKAEERARKKNDISVEVHIAGEA